MNYHTRKKVWEYFRFFYQRHKTTPTIKIMLTELGFDREKLRRALKGLIGEGYIREARIKNKKFFVLLRGGKYIP